MSYTNSTFYNFANVTDPGGFFTVVNDASSGYFSLLILFAVFFLVYFYSQSFVITKRFVISTGSLMFVAPLLFFAGWISWEWLSVVFALFILSLAALQFLRIQ